MFKLLFAIWLAKIISFLTTTLKIGGGSAAPGYYALKFAPDLITHLAKQIPHNIVITGTNGKTTTARLLNHLITAQNTNTLRNSTGSNLERGIASALLSKVDIFGNIKNVEIGIWELDEAAFNTVLFKLKPELIVFLNAFRDQLDRYGEVDTVKRKWEETLRKVDWNSHLVINEGDYTIATLERLTDENPKLTSSFFKVRGHKMFSESESQTIDPLGVDKADFEGRVTQKLGLKGNEVEISYPGGKMLLHFHIPGVYQIYNLLAAFSVYYALNFDLKPVAEKLKTFKPAFGRVEEVSIKGTESMIFLIKNPTGANNVFETISAELKEGDLILAALNDNFADGKDVSWIWDAEFEQLSQKEKVKNQKQDSGQARMTVMCSGIRAFDIALRFKYAGFAKESITTEKDLTLALNKALAQKPNRLFILPTYTALLELQSILAKLGVKKHYWKEV
jgi:UDP-N-acetylmuramyl tripeptide synthase